MKRINLNVIYELGGAISPLTRYNSSTQLSTEVWNLFVVHGALNNIKNSELELRLSRNAVDMLYTTIQEKIMPFLGKPESIESYLHWTIQTQANTLQTVLKEEIASLHTYFVSSKTDFNTRSLVESADDGFTDFIRSILNYDIKLEWNQAGKCLAFELSTASGFHCLRAVELSILLYYENITGKKMPVPDNKRNWGEYIKQLKDAGASEKITSILSQIKDLHRNPLMHPEDTLSLDEAIILYNLCKCFISSLFHNVEKKVVLALAANNN